LLILRDRTMGKSEVCDEAHGPAAGKHPRTLRHKRLGLPFSKGDSERTPAASNGSSQALQETVQAVTARIEQLEQRLNRTTRSKKGFEEFIGTWEGILVSDDAAAVYRK